MRIVGIDVGGTFTDFVLSDSDSGEVRVHKHPTTPAQIWLGVVEGLRDVTKEAGWSMGDIALVVHGTTVSTNALLEYKGAKTGMITTEGFRDIIHVGRHQRPHNYSIKQEIPWQHRPLVQRRYRKPVPERIAPPHGEVLTPLDEARVRQAVAELKAEGVEAIAICFLFSFLNSAHEDRAEQIVREVYPEAYVTTSSSVYPQFREFERFTTAAMNVFIGPKTSQYISSLVKALEEAGVKGELHIMQSNGGLATPEIASAKPATTVASGPVGGIAGGTWAAEHLKQPRLITIDIGGTSADIGVVTEGGVAEAASRDTWIAGYPVMVPMLDIESIGAGGGSIAYLDPGGALHVGPRSAGAVPGPACYGQGGEEPAVTDAHVVMGYVRAEHFLGGRMSINPSLSEDVVTRVGKKLNLETVPTAAAILRIINENMAIAIRSRTIQRGLDPEDFMLVGFGGAGPLHAVELARLLNVPQVLIPAYPGVVSAQGLLATDLRYDSIQVLLRPMEELTAERINAGYEELLGPLRQQLRKDGIPDSQVRVRKTADMRYIGQGYEITVELPTKPLGKDGLSQVLDAFHKKHVSDYGHDFPGAPIEMVSLKATAMGVFPKLVKKPVTDSQAPEKALLKTEEVYFTVNGELKKAATGIYNRGALKAGQTIQGPAIVVQMDSTTIIPPDASGTVDPYGNLIIKLEQTK